LGEEKETGIPEVITNSDSILTNEQDIAETEPQKKLDEDLDEVIKITEGKVIDSSIIKKNLEGIPEGPTNSAENAELIIEKDNIKDLYKQ
jgi:hypothetical protein